LNVCRVRFSAAAVGSGTAIPSRTGRWTSKSARRETVLLLETTVEIRTGTEAEEPDDVPIHLIDAAKCPGRKPGQFHIPESRVVSDVGDRVAGPRTEGPADQVRQNLFELYTDGTGQRKVLEIGRRSKDVATRHGQRPRAASFRERTSTIGPATSSPTDRRRSISPYQPGGT
jgi:hypothetical protein